MTYEQYLKRLLATTESRLRRLHLDYKVISATYEKEWKTAIKLIVSIEKQLESLETETTEDIENRKPVEKSVWSDAKAHFNGVMNNTIKN